MRLVRAARADELAALRELAVLSGPGFTSLPDDPELLGRRLETSARTFQAGGGGERSQAAYVLMLEETDTGAVLGCAAVKAGVGLAKPFFNFKLLTIAQASAAAERRFDMDVLLLVNEFPGCTEVGSLFLRPEGRGGGAGRLLAQSRYLLIAAAPELFARRVIAELRGVVGADGRSVFWETLGARFFQMGFEEADHLSAVTDNQFILDLMPRYPIYVDLLPPAAQDVIGAVHPDGEGARALLTWEGFRYDRVIDIFDGGPLVSAPRDDIRTLRESAVVRVRPGDPGDDARPALISTDRLRDFRVTRAPARCDGDLAVAPPDVLRALDLTDGEKARIWLS